MKKAWNFNIEEEEKLYLPNNKFLDLIIYVTNCLYKFLIYRNLKCVQKKKKQNNWI